MRALTVCGFKFTFLGFPLSIPPFLLCFLPASFLDKELPKTKFLVKGTAHHPETIRTLTLSSHLTCPNVSGYLDLSNRGWHKAELMQLSDGRREGCLAPCSCVVAKLHLRALLPCPLSTSQHYRWTHTYKIFRKGQRLAGVHKEYFKYKVQKQKHTFHVTHVAQAGLSLAKEPRMTLNS